MSQLSRRPTRSDFLSSGIVSPPPRGISSPNIVCPLLSRAGSFRIDFRRRNSACLRSNLDEGSVGVNDFAHSPPGIRARLAVGGAAVLFLQLFLAFEVRGPRAESQRRRGLYLPQCRR